MVLTIIAFLAVYAIPAGITFVILGEKFCPDDYWEGPLPLFGCILWPLTLPASLGTTIGRRFAGKGSSKYDKKLKSAQERLEIAKVEAQITRELERALKE